MTVIPQNHFICDRCGVTADMAMQSAAPAHARASGPAAWLCLVVGTEPNQPAEHLCGDCAKAYHAFFDAVRTSNHD